MSKEKLSALEASGEYLFHGSPDGTIVELEPRQGHHIPDISEPTKAIPDGRPAVSATPHAKLAIFRAIVNRRNVNLKDWHSGFGVTNGVQEFRISSQEVLGQLKDKNVYVFDKKGFKPYTRGKEEDEGRPESMEWRAYEKVRPLEIIEVTDEDLPDLEKIKIGSTEQKN